MQLNERIKIVPETGVTVKKRVADYLEENPTETLIRLDQALMNMSLPAIVIDAMKEAVDETASPNGVLLSSPWSGYDNLKKVIAEHYAALGTRVQETDIFVTSGLESGHSTVSNLFSLDNTVLLPDPQERHLLELQQMKGRNVAFYRATPENQFTPLPPEGDADLVYLSSPDPVTGACLSSETLQKWVDWANEKDAVIVYDSSLSEYLAANRELRSIYQIPGASTCAIELFSFEKGYGVRELKIGYIVVPSSLVRNDTRIRDLICARQPATATPPSYIMQRAAELLFSREAKEATEKLLHRIKKVAAILSEGLSAAGIPHLGGADAPFLWVQCPEGMNCWQFFDLLMEKASVVVTPGSVFGYSGERFVRMTAFGLPEEAQLAVERIGAALKKKKAKRENEEEKKIADELFQNME